eukprot:s122_g36.t5
MDGVSSWTKALEFLKEGRGGREPSEAVPEETEQAEQALATEVASLTSTVPLLESETASPKSPTAAEQSTTELSAARLPRPTSPQTSASLPTCSLEHSEPQATPISPKCKGKNGDRKVGAFPALPQTHLHEPSWVSTLRKPSPRNQVEQAPTTLRQKPAALSLSPTASSPGLSRGPKVMLSPSPSTPATPATPPPHRRTGLSPPSSYRSPEQRSPSRPAEAPLAGPSGPSPVLRSRPSHSFGSPPPLSPAAHRRLLEFNPTTPSQVSDSHKNSSPYAELHRRRAELVQAPQLQATPRRAVEGAQGVRRMSVERSPSPRVPEEGSPSLQEQARGMENFRAAWVRVGDLQMRHESFWEDYPDAVRALDLGLSQWLGYSGLPAVEEGLRRATPEMPKAAETHWVQDATDSDPFGPSVCRALLQTGTLPPSARTALRQRGAKAVAKSLLQQVRQLHTQALQRYRAACQAAAAAKLRQLKAGLDEQRQDEIRAEKVFRANAREQRAGYETPSDWTRARLDEIEAKKERQGAYLRRWSIKDFSSLRVLGKGAFGVVHLVQRQGTEEVYALKQIQKAHYINKNRKKAYNERDALARGWGTWFVDLLCTFQDSEHIYIVMEFVQGGDFFAYMEKKDKLSMVETRFYMAELISAINAIHQCGFIHRDLKPDNLVLTAQGHLKLLDFGLCTPVDLDEYVTQAEEDQRYQGITFQERPGREGLRTACGTPQYMAPEMFIGRACAASDLWALGVITFECLSGSLPFYTQSRDRRRAFQELRSQIQHHESNLPTRLARMQKKQRDLGANPQDCLHASQFVSKVLCPVERRITTFECKLDDFFEGLDFNRLQEMTPPYQPTCKSAADASNFDEFPAEKLPTPEDVTCMDPDLDWPLYEDDAKAARAREVGKARLRASALRAATLEEKEKIRSSLEPAAPVRKPRSAGVGRALGAFGVEACFDTDSLYRPRGHVVVAAAAAAAATKTATAAATDTIFVVRPAEVSAMSDDSGTQESGLKSTPKIENARETEPASKLA